MKMLVGFTRKGISVCLTALLLASVAQAQSSAVAPLPSGQSTTAQSATSADPQAQTNSPTQNPPLQPATNQQANEPAQPVGTAAAPAEKALGVTASRPSGAVIAPPKQRRARSFVIRMGIVVGACVAVGTVVALSHGSSSTPH